MPVQIDELIITTTVNPPATNTGTMPAAQRTNIDISKEIAEKVLEVIREKSER